MEKNTCTNCCISLTAKCIFHCTSKNILRKLTSGLRFNLHTHMEIQNKLATVSHWSINGDMRRARPPRKSKWRQTLTYWDVQYRMGLEYQSSLYKQSNLFHTPISTLQVIGREHTATWHNTRAFAAQHHRTVVYRLTWSYRSLTFKTLFAKPN